MPDIIAVLGKGIPGLFVIALPALVSAGPQTPYSIPGVTVISAEQAKTMVEKETLIVDTRVANEYVEEHIKGAISVPYKEKSKKTVNYDPGVDSFDLSLLPSDKNTPVILYCNAGECWKSYKSSKAALKAGYKKVYWLRGGIPEWKAKGFPVE